MLLNIDKKETGKQIRRIMKETGYTCKDIQNYLSLSCVQTVYRWLDGTNLPTLDNLYALSKLMGSHWMLLWWERMHLIIHQSTSKRNRFSFITHKKNQGSPWFFSVNL